MAINKQLMANKDKKLNMRQMYYISVPFKNERVHRYDYYHFLIDTTIAPPTSNITGILRVCRYFIPTYYINNYIYKYRLLQELY